MSRVPYQHGLVIGKFYPPHLGHIYLIRTAAAHCQQVTVGVLGASVETITIAQRVAYCLRKMGTVVEVGKQGNARLYQFAATGRPAARSIPA